MYGFFYLGLKWCENPVGFGHQELGCYWFGVFRYGVFIHLIINGLRDAKSV